MEKERRDVSDTCQTSLIPESGSFAGTTWQERYKRNQIQNIDRNAFIRVSLALSLVPNVGAGRICKLYNRFQPDLSLLSRDWAELASVGTIGAATARAIRQFNNWEQVDAILTETKKHNLQLVTQLDSCYPELLREIYDPPILLWLKGNPEALKTPCFSIVGTRRPSTAGRKLTTGFTRDLVRGSGFTIVSGLAHGIDSLAHTAALEENGCTIAVLGSGVDRIYPQQNIRLAYRIMNTGGAVISEFPPGTKPDPQNFPVRNRIVSGISVGVLVTETDLEGGSQITIDRALHQNREVFIVPHDIRNPRGKGCNVCIQRGWGKLVTSVGEIFEELPPYRILQSATNSADVIRKKSDTANVAGKRDESRVDKLDDRYKRIVRALTGIVIHIDDLAKKLDVATSDLLTDLLELELSGWVIQKPGKKFTVREW